MSKKSKQSNRFLITMAWVMMLCVSILPNALLHEFGGGTPVLAENSIHPAGQL